MRSKRPPSWRGWQAQAPSSADEACAERRARRAVTLLELLLVVGILAMLAAFAWPTFDSTAQRERLDESVRRLKTLIAMCRAEAMSDMRCFRISFLPDGSMKLRQQLDPVAHAEVYIPVQKEWASLGFLLDGVWIESICLLPDGPPPVQVDDELKVFEDMERDFEPVEIERFEEPIVITFKPDGTSRSLRWIMRDDTGRGAQMTLDGRLGRVTIEDVEALKEGEVQRPPEINLDQEAELERAKWEEAGWEPHKP
jgi:prepilin-type N-terminal cleavage/methylation domain-containing protein